MLELKGLAKKSKGLVPAGVFAGLLGSKLVLANKLTDLFFRTKEFHRKSWRHAWRFWHIEVAF